MGEKMSAGSIDPHQTEEIQPGELVARRVREIRKERGFSLRVLSEISGLNVNTLSLIEMVKHPLRSQP